MNLRMIDLTLPMFKALAAGEVDRATRMLGVDIPPTFMERTEVWDFFIRLLEARPESEGWTMKAVVDGDVIVGNAGFKGAPDDAGMVEIGYGIQPDHRRRGYAVAAVRLLLERAGADPRVRIVQAVVDPANEASIAVVTKSGFTRAEDFIHPRDGRQLRFTRLPIGKD